MVPTDARAHVIAENSPGARLYPAIVVSTTKPMIKTKWLLYTESEFKIAAWQLLDSILQNKVSVFISIFKIIKIS
jgi:hypothetical protein